MYSVIDNTGRAIVSAVSLDLAVSMCIAWTAQGYQVTLFIGGKNGK